MFTRRCSVLVGVLLAAAAFGQDDTDAKKPSGPAVIRRLGDTRWRQTSEINTLAFSPDGKTLAVDRVLWDVKTGQRQRSLTRESCGQFWCVAFAPDGTLFASGQDHDVMQFDAKTGKLLKEFKFHDSVVWRFSLSADGKTMASGDVSKKLALWDVASGKLLRHIRHNHPHWASVALSPDGKLVAFNGPVDKPVQIVDVPSGRLVGILKDGANANFVKLRFTPDGKTLIGGGYGDIHIWDVDSGKLRHHVKTPHDDHVEDIAVAPDGKRFVVVGWNERLHIWNIEKGKVERTLTAPGARFRGVAISPDCKTIAAGGPSGSIHLWDADSGKVVNPSAGHTNSVEVVAWPARDLVLTAGRDNRVRAWNPATGKPLRDVPLIQYILAKSISADGSTMAGKTDDHIHVLDLATGKEKTCIKERLTWEAPVALSPDGSLVAYPIGYSQLHVRSTNSDERRVFPGPKRVLGALTFSRDGKTLIAGYEQQFKDPPNPQREEDPRIRRQRRDDPTVSVFDVASGKELKSFGKELPGVRALALAANGRLLAVGDTHHVHVWDLVRGKKSLGKATHHSEPTWLTFSPDGRLLLSLARIEDGTFHMYETATMTHLAHFKGHEQYTTSLAFSHDGRRVLSGDGNTTAIIWDATGIAPNGRLPKAALGDAELERHWQALGEAEASKAFPSLWKLVAAGERCVPFLKKHLRAAPQIDRAKVAACLKDLDDPAFAPRERAMRQLASYGDAIELDLVRFRDTNPSLEVRRRIQQLLSQLSPTSERLRARRALMVLEQIGSERALAILTALSRGERADSFTQEAKESLQRITSKKE